ncbi:MAG TPA: acyl-CoA dehydrogenase family protein [Umezawaea sp.]|nr:acyl-CoA dehydrogenase family protein [Umezawaea sp.]
MSLRSDLTRITRTVVAPAAVETDRAHRFPRAAVQAFGRAGILGMTVPRGLGGGGQGLAEASRVVEEVARHCGGTATVLRSHFAAVAVLNRHGDRGLRTEVAAGTHLSTLAVFQAGDLLTPTGAAEQRGDVVSLRDRKTWVVSAGEADSYVWSSPPVEAKGMSTLWLVSGQAPDLLVPAVHDGIGLRGGASTTVWADPVRVPASCRLGEDGAGLDTVLHDALPWFALLGSSVALGLMEGALAATLEHRRDRTADLARMRLRTDAVRVLHDDAVAAHGWEPDRARRKVCQLTLAATDALLTVTDLAMKLCGDAAFRRDTGVERRFRDARAATAVEPTAESVLDLVARGPWRNA